MPAAPGALSRPVRVVVMGDSTAGVAGHGLIDWSGDHPRRTRISTLAAPGCGFMRTGKVVNQDAGYAPGCDALRAQQASALQRMRPDVALLVVSIGDVFDRVLVPGGPVRTPADADYEQRMTAEYERTFDSLVGAGVAKIAWVIPPTPDVMWSGDDVSLFQPARWAALRSVVERMGQRHPDVVTVIDLDAWHRTRHDLDRPDGLHYSPDAAYELADQLFAPVLTSLAASSISARTSAADTTPAPATSVAPATTAPTGTTTTPASTASTAVAATASTVAPVASTVPAPPPSAAPFVGPTLPPSVTRPVRILIVGDSTAMATGVGMTAWADANPDWATVDVVATPGCGFIRDGVIPTDADDRFRTTCRDLIERRIPRALRNFQPDVVVAMVTLRDIENRVWDDAEGPLGPADDRFTARLAADYTAMTQQFLDAGVAEVVWTLPPIPEVFYQGDAAHVLEPLRYERYAATVGSVVAAFPGQASVADLRAWLTARGSNPERPDGLHWSSDGAFQVADEYLAAAAIVAAVT